MHGLRDLFALYAIAAASLLFVAVLHLTPLFSTSASVGAEDRSPGRTPIVSVPSTVRHGAGLQNPNTLVKPTD